MRTNNKGFQWKCAASQTDPYAAPYCTLAVAPASHEESSRASAHSTQDMIASAVTAWAKHATSAHGSCIKIQSNPLTQLPDLDYSGAGRIGGMRVRPSSSRQADQRICHRKEALEHVPNASHPGQWKRSLVMDQLSTSAVGKRSGTTTCAEGTKPMWIHLL